MKINRLEHTKSLYPHFFDKTDESNFTKHLKVVGKQQQDIRHKLKCIEWSRILEKPLQIWKTQTEPYIYDINIKCFVPYLKEVNVYKNPIVNYQNGEETIVGYDEKIIHETFLDDTTNFFEKVIKNIETETYKYDSETNEPIKRIIPNDTYILEVFTYDDYHFLKGYPQNDYTVKEDNVLQYRYNETFLDISIEEISYSKFLTFRVHKDSIRQIIISKNDTPFFKQEFVIDLIDTKYDIKDFSYTYFDDSVTNENTYGQGKYTKYYEIEEEIANYGKIYFAEQEKDEYVFRLPLTVDDFDEQGILKDTYDLEVITFEKRYKCLHQYDRVYTKRYCGYDNELGDCFDHDYSLDIIGVLLNVPRFRFYQVYKNNVDYLSRTYPTFYNRSTEDDYNYMKRLQYYISNYNHIPFPILEFWKYYHTDATIRSRRRIIGEMDETYIRTLEDGCGTDFIEDFESESIIEYSVNKATNIKGTSNFIDQGDGWYESIIVDNLYVVPNVDYRLKYGVNDNLEDVTPRLICYNRKGIELRTSPILIDSNKEWTYCEDPHYNQTLINEKLGDECRVKFTYEFIEDGNNEAYLQIGSDENNCIKIGFNYSSTYDGNTLVLTNESNENSWVVDNVSFESNSINVEFYITSNDESVQYNVIVGDNDPVQFIESKDSFNNDNVLYKVFQSTNGKITNLSFKNRIGDYNYTIATVNIPSDTVSIKIILESNDSFNFGDVLFERVTVVNFDNAYMTTETDYNSNVYELYANYNEIPSNIRMGSSSRFDILFKRSLPLTKRGFFLMEVDEKPQSNLKINTAVKLYASNLIGTNEEYTQDISKTITQYITEDMEYYVTFYCRNNEHESYSNEETTDYLINTSLTFYDENDDEITQTLFDDEIDSDIDTRVFKKFITPTNTTKIKLEITNTVNEFTIWNLRVGRTEELTEDEVT